MALSIGFLSNKMKKNLLIIAFFAPVLTFAANAAEIKTNYIKFFLDNATTLINSLAIMVVSITILYFIINVISFMRNNMIDKAKRAEAAQGMIWSVVALAVMVSIWGIVSILQGVFFGNFSSQIFRESIKGSGTDYSKTSGVDYFGKAAGLK
jgi:hypothetical protein